MMRGGFIIGLFAVLCSLTSFAQDADKFFEEWKSYESAGKFEDAVPYFKKAIKQFPDEPWLYVFVGYSLVQIREYAEAVAYLDEAVRLAPDKEEVLANAGYVYFSYANDLAFSKGKWEDSIAYYKKSAMYEPRNAHIHVMYGNALRYIGRHEEALDVFTEAVKLGAGDDPNNLPEIRTGILDGMEYFQKIHEYGKAIAFGELGRALFPDDKKISELHFFSFLLQGNYEDAQNHIKPMKESPLKQIYKAAILFFQGRTNEAESAFKTVSPPQQSDYTLDETIASVYELKIRELPYEDRMKNQDQEKLVSYETAATEKYFRLHPYKQTKIFLPPLRGEFYVFQGEGGKSFHYGPRGHYSYDLGRFDESSFGAPIVSVADGKVIEVVSGFDDDASDSGVQPNAHDNYIKIDHGEVISVYRHIKKDSNIVKVGDQVRTGQIIAEIGNSEKSRGPYLHFSLQTKDGITLPVEFSKLSGRKSNESKFSPKSRLIQGYIYTSK